MSSIGTAIPEIFSEVYRYKSLAWNGLRQYVAADPNTKPTLYNMHDDTYQRLGCPGEICVIAVPMKSGGFPDAA